MSQNTAYQDALQKAERFLARSNFPLAKKAFETAWQLQPSEELQEKIRICSQEIDLQKRKELIKRGRHREKRGRYREALQCFEQAVAQREEDWLVKKIRQLKDKLLLAEVTSQIKQAEASSDLEAALAAYDNALQVSATPELIAKQATSLVRAGRYQQAIDVFTNHPPTSDAARYYFGYACASTGQCVKALEQWNAIEDVKDATLWRHVETLLPFVRRELNTSADPHGYAIAYQSVQKLVHTGRSPQLIDYANDFKYKYIEALWNQARYTELVALLLPLPDKMSLPLLGLYARVYYKLASQDPQHLEMAITFWLTAIYNDSLLQSLSIYQIDKEGLDTHAVRDTLLRDLETCMHHYERQNRLPATTRTYWQLEKRLIHELATLPVDRSSLDIFPCTPGFAEKFGLSEAISTLLSVQSTTLSQQGETFIEVSAYYSKAGRSLVLMEQGEGEQALASLPKNARDDVSAYCRQRVLFRHGLRKALQGEKQTKRWFLEALPLLKSYSRYRDELAELALTDLEPNVYAGLAEAMEALSKHITTPNFLEATAHVMSVQAIQLRSTGVSTTTAEKLLNRALAIYPESHLAQTTLQEMQKTAYFEQINKAFKQQNLARAANIIDRSGDPELIDYFFETVDRWHQQVEQWDKQDRLGALREFYTACYRVDRHHPLTTEIGRDLAMLEKQ
jgi:tetratricopeptide (TPR) repeat protein